MSGDHFSHRSNPRSSPNHPFQASRTAAVSSNARNRAILPSRKVNSWTEPVDASRPFFFSL